MAKELRIDISLQKPSPRVALPLLSLLLLLCVPVLADNGAVTSVKTYYPIPYGGLIQPTVSQKFEFKPYKIVSGSAPCAAAVEVSSGGGFGSLNISGDIFTLSGHSVELAAGGTGGRVMIGASSYLREFLMWFPVSSLPAAYDPTPASPTHLPSGPYWVPICNGITTGTGAICNFTTAAPTHRLFMRANILFGAIVTSSSCGLRLFINSGTTLPVAATSGADLCPGYKP